MGAGRPGWGGSCDCALDDREEARALRERRRVAPRSAEIVTMCDATRR